MDFMDRKQTDNFIEATYFVVGVNRKLDDRLKGARSA